VAEPKRSPARADTGKGAVGPNTVDILEYLIGQNTDFGTDAASFNAVRA